MSSQQYDTRTDFNAASHQADFGGRTAQGQFSQFGQNATAPPPSVAASQQYSEVPIGSTYKSNIDHTAPVYEKLHQFGKLVDSIGVCMMCTRCPDTGALTSRPMQLRHRESTDLFFITSLHSPKLLDVSRDEHINIGFLNESSGEWCSLNGYGSIIRWADFAAQEANQDTHLSHGRRSFSKDLLRKIWTPAVKHWAPESSATAEARGTEATPALEHDLAIVVVHALSVHYGVASNSGGAVKNAMKRVMGSNPNGDNIIVREITGQEIDAVRGVRQQNREE